MKKIVLASLAFALGWSGTAFAQTEVDALRYSQLGVAGSARIQGLGGAQTALGADISNLAGNPAGIGMFRRSEFSITPALQYSISEATANGATQSDERNLLTIPQAGLILSNRKGDEDASDWRGLNFGIGFTRFNNFNQRISYNNTIDLDERFEQELPPNTIVDYFADLANTRGLVNGETIEGSLDKEYVGGIKTREGLAYNNYLINFRNVYGDATANAQPLYSLGDIAQIEETEYRGSQNQIDIGVGTSYRDKIYLGASVGIVTTNFTQQSSFRESGYYIDAIDPDTEEIILDGDYNLELYEDFATRGAGVNLKVGVIGRPIDALRIGASIQTPTAYTLTDTYQRTLTSTTLNPETGTPESISSSIVPGEITYQLTTPFRATGGVAVFLGKYGFLTGDVEFVNYANSRFKEDDEFGTSTTAYFTDMNSNISNTYQSAINYKIGAEGRYEAFRLRVGYAYTGDPYQSAAQDGSVSAVTAGAGIRLVNWYTDLGFVSSRSESRFLPYKFSSGGGEPVIDIDNRQNSVLLTIGYNF